MATTTSTTTATLPFLSSFHQHHHRPHLALPNPNSKNISSARFVLSCSCSSSSSSSSSSREREEALWRREEQRWLREEQRWLREEKRWSAERDALLAEVAALRRRVRGLESEPAVEAVVKDVAPMPRPMLVEQAEVKEMVIVEEVERKEEGKGKGKERRRVLRSGTEGDDVRAMQEALQKLGFYSGEEDMEYSSFSSGTERAVKTWQATVGTAEDGVMTSELLERLFTGHEVGRKGGVNGAAVASVTEIAEIQKTVVKESGGLEVKASEHRVFLLGENRWEDSSRLVQKNTPISSSSAVKCITCRGEGRVMCTECDGSGEPNIEPQFLEWVGEDTKCPYCEGRGYTICDVCEGVVEN